MGAGDHPLVVRAPDAGEVDGLVARLFDAPASYFARQKCGVSAVA